MLAHIGAYSAYATPRRVNQFTCAARQCVALAPIVPPTRFRPAKPGVKPASDPAPVGSPWMWTLAFGYHEDRTPTHGYAETREAAMAAFAKSWRRD